jgi:hypothetical protein
MDKKVRKGGGGYFHWGETAKPARASHVSI